MARLNLKLEDAGPPANHALVLQGGGALGAFELGVAKALYADSCRFFADVISGVSIGAITAALLARPAPGLTPLEALETFWREVTVSRLFPDAVQPYLSMFGAPNFYALNPLGLFATSLYQVDPLRATLERLVDQERLADTRARPHLVFTATNLEQGELEVFRSDRQPLAIDHVLASGALPPSFPAVRIDKADYWDGGVFDNTPLGAVIDMLDGDAADRAVLVVNLFPRAMPAPVNMADVGQHFLNLLFANKTDGDVRLMQRFDLVAQLMADLAALPEYEPVRALPSYRALAELQLRRVPNILQVTRASPAQPLESADFSHAGIARRAEEGFEQTRRELVRAGFG
jgi:predicted acylesterase/phospholipase RssA